MKEQVEKNIDALEDAFNDMSRMAVRYIHETMYEDDIEMHSDAMKKFRAAIAALREEMK